MTVVNDGKLIEVKPHQIASADFAHHEWNTGSIFINSIHHDHTSELITEIEITTTDGQTGDKVTAWGRSVFKGTLAELIALISKVEADKAAAASKPV